MKKYTIEELAFMVDHTQLAAYALPEAFDKLCKEAVDYGFRMVAINSVQAIGDFTATTVGGMEREPTDSELQGGIVKLQIAFREEEAPQLPAELNILHASQLGRVHTLIVRGDPKAIRARMALYDPLLMEALPLSLEEIFIYEMGGEHYGVQDIVL